MSSDNFHVEVLELLGGIGGAVGLQSVKEFKAANVMHAQEILTGLGFQKSAQYDSLVTQKKIEVWIRYRAGNLDVCSLPVATLSGIILGTNILEGR